MLLCLVAFKKYESVLNGISISLSGSIVYLPCFTSISEEEQERVIDSVKKWIKSTIVSFKKL
jgi:dTDP-4-amino-4,6-dideoxygalactose transaminase